MQVVHKQGSGHGGLHFEGRGRYFFYLIDRSYSGQ